MLICTRKRNSSGCCHGVAEATGALRAVGALGARGAIGAAGAAGAVGAAGAAGATTTDRKAPERRPGDVREVPESHIV